MPVGRARVFSALYPRWGGHAPAGALRVPSACSGPTSAGRGAGIARRIGGRSRPASQAAEGEEKSGDKKEERAASARHLKATIFALNGRPPDRHRLGGRGGATAPKAPVGPQPGEGAGSGRHGRKCSGCQRDSKGGGRGACERTLFQKCDLSGVCRGRAPSACSGRAGAWFRALARAWAGLGLARVSGTCVFAVNAFHLPAFQPRRLPTARDCRLAASTAPGSTTSSLSHSKDTRVSCSPAARMPAAPPGPRRRRAPEAPPAGRRRRSSSVSDRAPFTKHAAQAAAPGQKESAAVVLTGWCRAPRWQGASRQRRRRRARLASTRSRPGDDGKLCESLVGSACKTARAFNKNVADAGSVRSARGCPLSESAAGTPPWLRASNKIPVLPEKRNLPTLWDRQAEWRGHGAAGERRPEGRQPEACVS